ncbi:MAG: hypothetical protein L6V91_10040 [Bacilli bacterium]|nr:MAG: hypothetical protein L6V91_10040 [Bacilli bacterium]
MYIIGTSTCIYLICMFLFSRWYVQGLKIKYLTDDIINSTDIIEKDNTNSDNNINKPDNDNPSDEENGDNDTPSDNDNYVYYPNDYWDYLNVPFYEC